MLIFTPRPFYSLGKSRRYPLDTGFRGPQRRSGRYREMKILDPTGTRNSTPLSSSPWPVDVQIALPRLTILSNNQNMLLIETENLLHLKFRISFSFQKCRSSSSWLAHQEFSVLNTCPSIKLITVLVLLKLLITYLFIWSQNSFCYNIL
jgi:hypothetical protein